jgi:BT4734-like, N-terminal domain/AAA domain
VSGPAISWVNSIRKAETHSADARDIIERMRDGQWKKWIAEVRAGKRPKDSLPAVMPSGTFSSRDGTNGSVADKLIQHSGLLCADLDKLGDDLEVIRGRLNTSKYLCTSFASPSGNGLKAWFYVPPDANLHAESFRAVEKYVLELTGIQIDQACKDVGRLCFVSDDPEAYYNPSRCELAPLPEPEKPKLAVVANVNLSGRQRIAGELVGAIDWQNAVEGYCVCPGKHMHTEDNGERDCIIYLEGRNGSHEPTIFCFHSSCRPIVEGINYALRSKIGKAEYQPKRKAIPQNQKAEQNGEAKTYCVLSTVDMKPIVYLDKPLWQRATFTLVTGKKGCGKSTLLYHEAARVTRGELGEKRNVIWISIAEDDYAMDVRPRLEAAGADCSKVIIPKNWQLVLPRDIDVLRRMANEFGGVGMIGIDPVSGAMPAGISSNNDEDVRYVIGPLNPLAGELDSLIVGVRHLKKSISGDIIDNVLGAGAWTAVPRVVLACATDTEDESVTHIKVVRGNRMPPGREGLRFRLEGVHVVEGGEPVVKAVLIGESNQDINDLVQTENASSAVSKTKQAKIAILDALEASDDGIESDNLTSRIADEYGLKAGTIKNAKTALKDDGLIRFVPEKDESGKVFRWLVKRTLADRPDELKKPHHDPKEATSQVRAGPTTSLPCL